MISAAAIPWLALVVGFIGLCIVLAWLEQMIRAWEIRRANRWRRGDRDRFALGEIARRQR